MNVRICEEVYDATYYKLTTGNLFLCVHDHGRRWEGVGGRVTRALGIRVEGTKNCRGKINIKLKNLIFFCSQSILNYRTVYKEYQ